MLPQVPDTTFMEHEGVLAVAMAANQAKCLWRPTTMHDVGIDGQIEYVVDGQATGRIVLVQVKAGESFFRNEREGAFRFYPPEKHKLYWERCPLPVILVLYNPENRTAIWADARAALRSSRPIDVPANQHLDAAGVLSALACDGPLPTLAFDPRDIINLMVQHRRSFGPVAIDFFDLFFHGLTDIATALYFSMHLVHAVAQWTMELDNGPSRYDIGQEEFAFIDQYVDFLITYDLARFDYDWWQRNAKQENLVGQFVAPLTERGLAVVRYVEVRDTEHPTPLSVVAQERFVVMLFEHETDRALHVRKFKEQLASS